jgi:hypothetical protein
VEGRRRREGKEDERQRGNERLSISITKNNFYARISLRKEYSLQNNSH